MSERKVLNKYYPPDFDASKLPRVKREKNRQFTIRTMVPFNMRCTTCGEYIYRGKKFNAKKEDVIGKTYLGIQIYRFYIKCTKCLAEITFLTDPENNDYAMEFGAIRNFESVRLAEIQAEKDAKKEKEEEENNPMKVLENRTRDSRREMAALETLEDLRELNAAHATVDPKVLLEEENERKRKLEEQQIEEDEEEIKRLFGGRKNNTKSLSDAANSDEKTNELIEEVIEEEPVSVVLKKPKIESKNDIKQEAEEPKIEEHPTTTTAAAASSSILFKKPSFAAQMINSKTTVADTKSKISSLIKKKPEAIETAKPSASSSANPLAVNPLASLASYSSSDDSDNNNDDD